MNTLIRNDRLSLEPMAWHGDDAQFETLCTRGGVFFFNREGRGGRSAGKGET